jgi:hypothetical protein
MLRGSFIFRWPAVVARGRRWGARWRSDLEAAREFLFWHLCAAPARGRPHPCRCLRFLRPAVVAWGRSGRRRGWRPPPSSSRAAFIDLICVKTSPSSQPAVAARERTVVLGFVGVGGAGLILTPMLRPIGASSRRPPRRQPQ